MERLEACVEATAEQIASTVEQLGLPETGYIVVGGANLVLRGLKDSTPDLDMLVSRDVLFDLAGREGAEIKMPPFRAIARGADNKTIWIKSSGDDLPVAATSEMRDGYYPLSYDSHSQEKEVVQGIACLGVEHVLRAKLAVGRDKDIRDLERVAESRGLSYEELSKRVGKDIMRHLTPRQRFAIDPFYAS